MLLFSKTSNTYKEPVGSQRVVTVTMSDKIPKIINRTETTEKNSYPLSRTPAQTFIKANF